MIKDTLYYQYIRSREDSQVLETEHAFIIYKIQNQECFMVDMYVDPNFRNKGETRKILSIMSEIAKNQNCKIITANIQVADKRALHNLLAAKGEGFNLVQAHNNTLLIAKSLEEK